MDLFKKFKSNTVDNIYSNHNDIKVYLWGYYSRYGLTVHFNQQFNNCIIYCMGLSCLNTNCQAYGISSRCSKFH